MTSSFLGGSISGFIACQSRVRRDPMDLHLPTLASELIECLYGLGEDILPGGILRIAYCLDSGLVVCEDRTSSRHAGRFLYIEYDLKGQ